MLTSKQFLTQRRRALANHNFPADTPEDRRAPYLRQAGEPFARAERAYVAEIGYRFVDVVREPAFMQTQAENALNKQWAADGARATAVYVAAFIKAKGLKP